MTLRDKLSNMVHKITPGHGSSGSSGASAGDNVPTSEVGVQEPGLTAQGPVDTGAAYATESTPGGVATYTETQTATYSTGNTGAAMPPATGVETATERGFNSTAIEGATMECVPGNVAAPVPVGERRFTVIEDHAVEKERVETYIEHQPIQREYVTRVEETGNVVPHATYVEGARIREQTMGEHTCFPVRSEVVEGVAGNTVDANRIPGPQ